MAPFFTGISASLGGQGGFGFSRRRRLPPLSWNYADGYNFGNSPTTSVINLNIASNVATYSLSSGSILSGLSLNINGSNDLIMSGTLAQFGYAGIAILGESGTYYTFYAADFGVTKNFSLTLTGLDSVSQTRTFTHRQVGNIFISKQFESYGTPSLGNWVSLAAQQNNCTTNPNFSVGGCHSSTQRVTAGGTSVTLRSDNLDYGDPCSGTQKRLCVSLTV